MVLSLNIRVFRDFTDVICIGKVKQNQLVFLEKN
jgi:hypothetical protein